MGTKKAVELKYPSTKTYEEPNWRKALERAAKAPRGVEMAKLKAAATWAGSGVSLPGDTPKTTLANHYLEKYLDRTDLYVGHDPNGRALFFLIADPTQFDNPKSDWLKGRDVIVAYVDKTGQWQRESWAPGSCVHVLHHGLVL